MGNKNSTANGGMGGRATSTSSMMGSRSVSSATYGGDDDHQAHLRVARSHNNRRAPAPRPHPNRTAYVEFSVRNDNVEVVGEIKIHLREDIVPTTAENFLRLCQGEGFRSYGYVGSNAKIIKNFAILCGEGGNSAVAPDGGNFPSESFELHHDAKYVVSMLEPSRSAFQILLVNEAKWLDTTNVVFGKVDASSHEVMHILESYGTTSGKPSSPIFISRAGLLPPTAAPAAAVVSAAATTPTPSATGNVVSSPLIKSLRTVPNSTFAFCDFAFAPTADGPRIPIGCVTFELYAEDLPRSCENFMRLCTGSMRQRDGRLTYKNTDISRCYSPAFSIQWGDTDGRKGFGGRCALVEGLPANATTFPDEKPNSRKHSHVRGALCYAVAGPDQNASQVYVLLADAPHLDADPAGGTVFGRVAEGLDLLCQVQDDVGTANGIPRKRVIVADCGQLVDADVAKKDRKPAVASAAAAAAVPAHLDLSNVGPNDTIHPPLLRKLLSGDDSAADQISAVFLHICECPICLQSFDSYSRLPTTLPCGHSICLAHSPLIHRCPVCRSSFPQGFHAQPSYVLKDLLEAFAPAEGQSVIDCRKAPPARAGTPTREASSDHVFDNRLQPVATRPTQQQPAPVSRSPPVPRRRTLTLTTPAVTNHSRQHRAAQMEAAASRAAAEAARAPRAPAAMSGPGIGTENGRGHNCVQDCCLNRSGARYARCCVCADSRAGRLQDANYEKFVDGCGFVSCGRRWEGYCPHCKSACEREFA